jgi:hypothetical protein
MRSISTKFTAAPMVDVAVFVVVVPAILFLVADELFERCTILLVVCIFVVSIAWTINHFFVFMISFSNIGANWIDELW